MSNYETVSGIILSREVPVGHYRIGIDRTAYFVGRDAAQIRDTVLGLTPDRYKVVMDGDSIHLHDETDHLGATAYVGLSHKSPWYTRVNLAASETEVAAETFFMTLANKLYPEPTKVPFSDWEARTVPDLEFLARVVFTDSALNQEIQKMKKVFVTVPKQDDDLQYVLALADIEYEDAEGVIGYGLHPNMSGETASTRTATSNGLPISYCLFGPDAFRYHENRRWALASTLGWHMFGKDFGYKPQRYSKKRQVSDMALAAYAKFAEDDSWDPRNHDAESLDTNSRASVSLLSGVWNKSPSQEERLRLIREIWRDPVVKPEKAEEIYINLNSFQLSA